MRLFGEGKAMATEETRAEKLVEIFRSLFALFVMVVSGATFLGAWIYCAMTAGFLFGFGLGWLPAGILAGIVFVVGAAMLRG